MSLAGHLVTINDIELYYEVHGEGAPLLILHGFTGSSAGIAEGFKAFSHTHQLIIPDIRGHGRSTNPSKKFTFHQAAKDIIALLKHLKIETCHAIGFSGGGCILLQLAYHAPYLLQSMTLVSAAPYFPEQTQIIMQQFATQVKSEAEWQAMREIHFHGDEQIKLLWAQAGELNAVKSDMDFTPAKLKQIKTKTLLIQGDRDPLYPLSLTIEMYENLPHAYLWIIANGGHVPITRNELPELMNKLKSLFY